MRLTITALSCLLGMTAFAGVPSEAITTGAKSEAILSDLTLSNLFSEGWDQEWAKRPHPGGAPDMALLRVQNNFLERELRMDYYFEHDVSSASKENIHYFDTLVAWGLNRRIMVEAVGIYEWIDPREGHKAMDGATGAFLGRLQLIDTQNDSYAFNLRIQPPDHDVGDKTTTMSFALAGWHDLTTWGLPRMGLYYHIQEETFLGPTAAGAKRNDLTYAVSLAKTWTAPDAVGLRNFTTFLECYTTTDLDGSTRGHTATGLTPGVRFTVGHHHVFLIGADIPLTDPRPYTGGLYRFTYIYNFD